jgi:hypothetical protein
MDSFKVRNFLDKQRQERKEIWNEAEAFGKREALKDTLAFLEWYDNSRNPDLMEIKWYIEARIRPVSHSIVNPIPLGDSKEN